MQTNSDNGISPCLNFPRGKKDSALLMTGSGYNTKEHWTDQLGREREKGQAPSLLKLGLGTAKENRITPQSGHYGVNLGIRKSPVALGKINSIVF